MSELIKKYYDDLKIRHDKEILSKFFDDLCLSLLNKKEYEFSIIEKDLFIDAWIERHYFKKDDE